MNSTIYIRKENEDRWSAITDKSAWVNAYLSKNPPNSVVIKERLEPMEPVATYSSPDKFVPKPPDPETGDPCCIKAKPCKHWQWNGEEQAYINELTGEVREP